MHQRTAGRWLAALAVGWVVAVGWLLQGSPSCLAKDSSEKGAAASSASFQEPLELIARARTAYAKVRDYSCLLIKREKLAGVLSPNHVIALDVRTSPFSVSMRWQEPKELKGQEVCFVTGKNDGKMRVRPAGLLGAIGHVSLAPDDPRVRRSSRHRITEAGIGHLIEQCHKGWPEEKKLGLTQVRIGNYLYARRPCRRVEMTHPTNPGGKFMNYRNVLYFDRENHLPIRVENYDWPSKPGDAGELVETYSYVNLRLNVGVKDELFQR